MIVLNILQRLGGKKDTVANDAAMKSLSEGVSFIIDAV